MTEAELASKEKIKHQREELEHAKSIFEAHKQRMEEINRRQQTKGTPSCHIIIIILFLFDNVELLGMIIINNLFIIVKLNIGGIRYETSVATLAKDGESMLAAMFSGLYGLSPDPDDGSIFIDRDGTHFRYILKYFLSFYDYFFKKNVLIVCFSYLRDGSFLPPREVSTLHELLQEAEYYQISGLIQILKEHLQTHDIENS